jgi:hypothetical protein
VSDNSAGLSSLTSYPAADACRTSASPAGPRHDIDDQVASIDSTTSLTLKCRLCSRVSTASVVTPFKITTGKSQAHYKLSLPPTTFPSSPTTLRHHCIYEHPRSSLPPVITLLSCVLHILSIPMPYPDDHHLARINLRRLALMTF